MTHLHDQTLTSERIELKDKQTLRLGPGLELRRCTLILAAPSRSLLLDESRFTDCTIESRRSFKDFYWHEAFLTGCTFTGAFAGCDFGRLTPDFSEHGGIERCDFSDAALDGCRFIGCDVSTLVLPTWPCFTVLDPQPRAAELAELAWPGESDLIVETFADFPETTSAVVNDARVLASEFGLSLEQLEAVVQQIPGVLM